MGASSLLDSATSLSWTLWQLLSLAITFTNAATFVPISQPSLDLSGLGRVGIAGDFNGISVYEFEGQTESSPFSNGSQSLMSRLPNGIFTTLASSDAQIQALCVHELSDGTIKGIFVGGNFTGLGNVPANGVALFNPSDGSVVALDGLIGKVHALLCDKDTNTVYVGGDFSGSNSSNAIAWVDGKGWTDLPFDGFNGPVKTITASPNNTITFGGVFTSLGNSSIPIVKHAQTVNLVSTNITAEQTTAAAPYNNPASIVCSDGTDSMWLLRDGQVGSWTADFKFGFKPTKLRLRNANLEGRGTKIFRFTAFPLDGIMNLTYTDPQTNETKYCDAWCELAEGASQDYFFVNDVGMSRIRIDIFEFYGAGGGLAGIELFQDDIFAFASPELNEPACASAAVRSSSTVTGQWAEADGPEVDSEYLSINLGPSQLSSASIVFEPHIQQSGEYAVRVFTPGCRQDNSCSSRGQVNITGTYTKDGLTPVATQFFQTNDFDKYDTVYFGKVDASDGSFRPRVTLTPASSQSLSFVNIVAQKVQFQLFSNMTTSSDDDSGTASPGSLELNGLYEFDPQQTDAPTASDIESSAISSAGRQLSAGATITTLSMKDDTTYAAGNFSADDGSFQHFFAIGPGGPVAPSKGGLNNTVYAMLLVEDIVYLGGAFQDTNTESTNGLGFIAAYNTQNDEWQALGAGVNGRVMDIVALSVNVSSVIEDAIALSGDFTRIERNGNSDAVDVDGFAVWIPSQSQWLERIEGDVIAIEGVISAAVSVPRDAIFYAGSIASQSLEASGAVSLLSTNTVALQALPMQFQGASQAAQIRRTIVPEGYEGVVTGVFYEQGDQNLTVLGGHFAAQGKDGTVNNLLIINGAANDEVTGFGTEVESTSTVLALLVVDTLLFIGGSLQGTVNAGDVSGMVIWDLSSNVFATEQPVGLEGNVVSVLAISRRPDTQDIYVGGAFSSAGSLPCPSLCIFDNQAKQWGNIGGDVAGQVDATFWLDSDTLLVGGDMRLNNTATYLAIYNAKASSWEAYVGDTLNIPGPVQNIAFDSGAKDSFFISGVTAADGSAYLMKYGGGRFALLEGLGDTTSIRNVQVLNVNTEHDTTDFLDATQSLLVLGSLDLPGFGNASAALYDGTTWTPFLLTSKASGEPGSISSLFSQREQIFSPERGKLAKGFVILISLAIALGLVFLIVVLGVLASYIRRRHEGYTPAPTRASPIQSMQMQERLSPAALFGSVGPNSGRPGGPIL